MQTNEEPPLSSYASITQVAQICADTVKTEIAIYRIYKRLEEILSKSFFTEEENDIGDKTIELFNLSHIFAFKHLINAKQFFSMIPLSIPDLNRLDLVATKNSYITNNVSELFLNLNVNSLKSNGLQVQNLELSKFTKEIANFLIQFSDFISNLNFNFGTYTNVMRVLSELKVELTYELTFLENFSDSQNS